VKKQCGDLPVHLNESELFLSVLYIIAVRMFRISFQYSIINNLYHETEHIHEHNNFKINVLNV
jgi:hypothetical protein